MTELELHGDNVLVKENGRNVDNTTGKIIATGSYARFFKVGDIVLFRTSDGSKVLLEPSEINHYILKEYSILAKIRS